MAIGTAIKPAMERQLWAAFNELLNTKALRKRHAMDTGPGIYYSTAAPTAASVATSMPNQKGDFLIQYNGSGVATNLWLATVTNGTSTYTWVCIAGSSVGTTVTQ